MKKEVLAFATVLGVFCGLSASFGQGRVDIVQIYSNFLASRVAALGSKPDQSIEVRKQIRFKLCTELDDGE
jgi:hypothetical protein